MYVELPDNISIDTIDDARPAAAALRALLAAGALPTGVTAASLEALLSIVAGITEAALEDSTDLNPSEAAERLGMARPSVMRLINRGELSARKDGGHYLISPRELRLFQTRLAATRQEALAELARMTHELEI